jgi:hypothetical protein
VNNVAGRFFSPPENIGKRIWLVRFEIRFDCLFGDSSVRVLGINPSSADKARR